MKKINLLNITTESINLNSKNIDLKSTFDILQTINNEDKLIALAVEKELDVIAKTVDEIYKRVSNNGKVFYIGAGSSGRIGVLDASEMLPTYGVGDMFYGIMAGGDIALRLPVEGAEDDEQLAINDLENCNINKNDVVFAIGASGRTPYCISALKYAKQKNALAISLSMTKDSEFKMHSDIAIEIDSGPEVVTGSTRMKSGTATKMVLNMISTTTMIKFNKVYDNLMVDVIATNIKLENRCINIIKSICKIEDENLIIETLKKANMQVKPAIIMILKDVDYIKAITLLNLNNNNLRTIIEN
ncbi:N-acetylmuramic acid 6-phosphate etherase [Spiroplasma diminutum]|uniref:N-acetylmuramic acid 6-phosphate etherase n=1 Tax=Spiroplasma diminutum CUAS-1 TaxID=1276221 RepID=S5MJW7_9MOLU|nr:N-acetylmuramic acid 6-phosphate etherase [Spiroplasma diminutum]AGR42250.1 N-acetylmuramic acid 6-phosphate etherase [Spiroplasma diminutum CUAS-1]